jgi:hypothetical protein
VATPQRVFALTRRAVALQVVCRDDASRRGRPKLFFLFWASLASVEAGIRSSQFSAEQEDLTCIVDP